MKFIPLPIFTLAAVSLISFATSLHADDWKTNDGKVYHEVKVLSSQPDSVTILHHDGGASIPLANLPADLQQKFHYDPTKAKAAAKARAREDVENRKRLQAEMNEASDMNQAGPEPTSDVPTGPLPAEPSKSNASDSTDLFKPALAPDPSDPSHHTMDDLTSSLTLRRDLWDPAYHTAAHLTYVIRSSGLGPDPGDPNHHTISEITAGGL